MATNKEKPNKHQPGDETVKAAAAKELYLSLGPFRSHEKVAKLLGRNKGYVRLIEVWSSKYGWVDAARAHDEEHMKILGSQFKEAAQDAIDEMNERQAKLARELHDKAVKRLNELIDAGELWGRDAVALYKESGDRERLSKGASTERIEAKQEIDMDATVTIEARWGTSSLDANEENKE